MKKITLLLAMVVFVATSTFAQIQKPVKLAYVAKKTGTDAILYIKATIDNGWHIYSQHTPDGGPVKTTFTFAPSKDYTLVGKVMEPKPMVKYEDSFKINVNYFEKQVIFQQKIKLKKGVTTVKGSVEFMVCNDKQCLPPDEVAFSIPVK
ncbi:sugar transporter [Pedobacter changchengzhani]|uniref:Sugar transporter n=1 Tax=Pedobacter changchengzhani TaxID=2529274 RepID=A0A4R5MPV4_9SPHI|nr:protein-disulfide reductase DsbD domain-containing protein [Pedobacter changchengzhani]TDG37395.1 sugar transporter [Pedobacter changchengzhani]